MEITLLPFQKIVQKNVWDRLVNMTKSFPNAMLFVGPKGTGKDSYAVKLFQWVNCKTPREGFPCEECVSCKKIIHGNHPDLILLKPEGQWHSVDRLREVKTELFYAPLESAIRLVIISSAHAMTQAAANAVLKTLEEPPAHTRFILTTHQKEALLPTILSRTQTINFAPLSHETLLEFIRSKALEVGASLSADLENFIAALCGDGLDPVAVLLQPEKLSFIRNLMEDPPRSFQEVITLSDKLLLQENENLPLAIDVCILLFQNLAKKNTRNPALCWHYSQLALETCHLKKRLEGQANKKLLSLNTSYLLHETSAGTRP